MFYLDENTEVVVYGYPDVVYGGYDLKKECTLKESVNVVKEHWNTLTEEDKSLYIFSVFSADDRFLVYEFYLNEFEMEEEVMNILRGCRFKE